REVADQLQREVSHMAIGTERGHGFYWHSFDERPELPFEVPHGSMLDKMDDVLTAGERMTYELSGNGIIQQAQEYAMGASILQKFANMADDLQAGKALKEGDIRRAAQLGIDQETMGRIFKEMRTHAKGNSDNPLFLGKLTGLNVDKWTDLDARAAFED